MQGDLIERLRGFALRVSEGINEACEEAIAAGEADNARIAALEADNARLMGLVKEAVEGFERIRDSHDAGGNSAKFGFNGHSQCKRIARIALAKIKEATDGRVTD